jgi:hypothetical protein
MCCGIPQQGALKDWQQYLAAHSSGSLQNVRVMLGNNRAAFATPSTWEGYAGRNFETELASFLVPGFPVPDPARGVIARERNPLLLNPERETHGHRRSSVKVCNRQGAAAAGSCTGKRQVQALVR